MDRIVDLVVDREKGKGNLYVTLNSIYMKKFRR